QHKVLAVLAVTHTAAALRAVGGAAVGRVVVGQQRRRLRVDLEDDVAALAPVAAVRAAEGLELLAVDGGDAVATVPAGHVQHDPVDEAGHRSSYGWAEAAAGADGAGRPPPPEVRSWCRSGLGRDDVDRLAAALGAELDRAGGQGEQGVVLAAADVVAGVELGAALADDDLAR